MISPPVPIADRHVTAAFDCGNPSLDAWLVRRALANQRAGGSRTYVACRGEVVVGYHALAAGAVAATAAPGRIRRNMPDPIPAIILGRLAVDRSAQGLGLGQALLNDALDRAMAAATLIGARCVLAHAVDERAAMFYERCGFVRSPLTELTMLIAMADIEAATPRQV